MSYFIKINLKLCTDLCVAYKTFDKNQKIPWRSTARQNHTMVNQHTGLYQMK